MKTASYDEYLHDPEHGQVNDYTKNGKCSRCGECCNRILTVKKVEIIRIAKYMDMHHIGRGEKIIPRGENTVDMTCPFYDEVKRRCLIYNVRPEVCRKFACSLGRKRIERHLFKIAKNAAGDVDMAATFFNDQSISETLPMLKTDIEQINLTGR